MAETASKKRKFEIPVLGDENDVDNYTEVYDMLLVSHEEACQWFTQIDRKCTREGVVEVECPSCCVKHPMHKFYQHTLLCISLRQELQGISTPSTSATSATPVKIDNPTTTSTSTIVEDKLGQEPSPKKGITNNNMLY